MSKSLYEIHENEQGVYIRNTRTGSERSCTDRQDAEQSIRRIMRLRKNLQAHTTRQVYADLGMHRVKGAQGGIYYE